MSDLAYFYVPLTLEQVDDLVASAYRNLPPAREPYYGFPDHEEAVRHAQAIANCHGIGFLVSDVIYAKDATKPVFSFEDLEDICPIPPEPDSLERFLGNAFPFQQVSLAETPYRGIRLEDSRRPLDAETGNSLEAAGFFHLDEIYPDATPWYFPNAIFAWDRFLNALARRCHLDDEDASERGFQQLWEHAQPFLTRLDDPPRFRYDAWTEEGYFICLDDTEYLAYRRDELGKGNPNWVYWAFETERLVEVLDRALRAKNIPERCLLCGWGNSSSLFFLTDVQREILVSQSYLRISS